MSWRCEFMLLSLAMVGCASGPSHSTQDQYYDSAYDDHNRAPASLLPPPNAAEIEKRIDSVSVRSKADYYFAMAEALSFDGQHEKAIEAFKSVLIYDPQAERVHLRLAAEYVKLGMMSEALDSAQMAVKTDPKSVDGHLLTAGIYSTLKDYDLAIKEYQAALAIDPNNTEAPMYMGAVYAEKKEYDKAVHLFERLAKNDDYSTPYLAWYYIGRIHADQEGKAHLKAAEKAYKKALSIKSDHADSVVALGQIYSKMGQPALAIETYKKFQRDHGPSERVAEILAQYYMEREQFTEALEQFEILERTSDDVLGIKVRIALILIELKRYPKAADKLYEVLRQVPESDKIRFYLAAVYEEMNDVDHAVEHFRKVPSGSPFYSESIIHAAYLLKSKKRLNEALTLVEDALGQRNDIPQFYTLAATIWDEKGDFNKAESFLNKGLEKFPDNVQLHFFLGTIQDRRGRKEQVIDQMKKVIEMDPNHVQGLNYLAFTYAEMSKNLDEAEKLVKRALEIEPKDGFILDTYGWVLYQKGKTSESVKFLEKAHESQPQESVISEHLGDAYYRLQLYEKARSMYQNAIDKTDDKKKVGDLEQKLTALDQQRKVKADNRVPASVNEH